MKTIKQDELFANLSDFLKTKGIELKEGSYAQNIKTGCGLLTDAINLGQKGLHNAKAKTDKTLDQMRQYIHEKTAPPAQSRPPEPEAAPKAASPAGKPTKAKTKSAKKKASRTS